MAQHQTKRKDKQMNITQVRRLIFRKWNGSAWSVFTMEPDDLGQDTIMTVNVAPRKRTRASTFGSTEHPIKGTFESLSASITFLLDTFEPLGQAIGNWEKATYTGASATAGQILLGEGDISCDDTYYSVVAQGLCEDGSEADIEITRCQPSVDDDLEFGTGDTPTVTLALNPIIYNAGRHSSDGYPAYTVRFGVEDTANKTRLNASTGAYN